MTMTIYHIEQVSWNDGAMSDFNLPRSLGYWTSLDLAMIARDKDIESRKGQSDDDGWTTDDNGWTSIDDYVIHKIEVRNK